VAARIPSNPACINTNQRSEYLQALQNWNAQLIEAQRPIRVLEAIRWPHSVEQEFFARGGRELPRVGRDTYALCSPTLSRAVQTRLRSLELDIRTRLPDDPASRLLIRRCRSYQDALRLIRARGTTRFAELSREIYGTSHSRSKDSALLPRLIDFLEAPAFPSGDGPRMPATEAAERLSGRLSAYFADRRVSVKLTEQLSADACAGTSYVKLRQAAHFSGADVDLLEVHEGWAHLGTAINGARQPLLTILGKSFPGATRTQEGLAVLTELVSGACHSMRRVRLAQRLRAVIMAEQGADFLVVYRFLLDRDHSETEAYRLAARVFRGSLPRDAGPFTKDLSYGLGLLSLARRLRAIPPGDETTIPLLFSGKTHTDELPDLTEFHGKGLLARGEFIPAPFLDRRHLNEVLAMLPTS